MAWQPKLHKITQSVVNQPKIESSKKIFDSTNAPDYLCKIFALLILLQRLQK